MPRCSALSRISIPAFPLAILFAGEGLGQTFRHTFSGTVADAGVDSPLADAVGSTFEVIVEHGADLRSILSTATPPPGTTGPDIVRTTYLDQYERNVDGLWVYSIPPIDFSILIDGAPYLEFVEPVTPAASSRLLRNTPRLTTAEGEWVPDPSSPELVRADLARYSFLSYSIELTDRTASFLEPGTMPTAFDAFPFDPGILVSEFIDPGTLEFRRFELGEVTSISSTVVPEPSTALLTGLGLVGLARGSRRRNGDVG